MTDSSPKDENALTNEQNDNAALGAFLGGMIAFDQAITNNLMDSHIDSAIQWASRFRRLFDAVRQVNRDLYVNEILQDFGWERADVARAIEHLESMKMSNRGE